MLPKDIRERDFEKEFVFTASRSSGPGGQHVNKVNSRMELRFFVHESQCLNVDEKEKILYALGRYISGEGILILVSQTERSQYSNKKKVTERFYKLVEKALKPVLKRKATRPTPASREKRIVSKKLHSEKKYLRKRENEEE